MMIDPISELLKHCSDLSEWTQWLLSDQNEGAKQTRRFLNHALECVAQTERVKFENELVEKKGEGKDDFLKELVAHQIFYQSGHNPRLYPSVSGRKTPDLSVDIGGQRFLADVFVTNSPNSTLYPGEIKDCFNFGANNSSDTLFPGEATDCGERGRKIAQDISKKATKYAKCEHPLIVIVFLGDHRILDTWNIEEGFYGVALSEFESGDLYPVDFNFAHRMGGAILPVDNEPISHQELSAVIVCDWFDTLNRDAPGKRIKCTILHHFDPLTHFPVEALAPFQHVFWEAAGNRSWKPYQSGQPNIVARLGANGRFVYGPYNSDNPW